jgi:uncharacterized membrane protein YfcA
VHDVFTWVTFAVLVLGFASGVLAGMFGIGGAVITTPAIRAMGATPIHAVGSTVPAILPGSVSGAYRYAKEGLVDWRVGLGCGAAGSVLAVAGAKAADLVNAHYLMVLTAGLLAFSGISIFRSARVVAPAGVPAAGPEGDIAEGLAVHPDEVVASAGAADAADPAPAGDEVEAPRDLPMGRLLAVGAGAGALAGLLGVGGGIVMVPAFTGLLKLPMKLAVGSSLVAVAIFSVPALITHMVLGHIDWRYALPLLVGVVPGAQVGARITMGSSDVVVRRMFGVFVTVLSVVYGVSEILGLRS